VPPLLPPTELVAIAGIVVSGETLVVLRLGPPAGCERDVGAPDDPLTCAERAVALLARRGMSNAEIGHKRGTSARTVAVQLASVYRKLGIGSRAELTAAALARR